MIQMSEMMPKSQEPNAVSAHSGRPLRILFLFEPYYLYINTIREHLESFDLYSRHHVSFASASANWDNLDLPMEDPPDYSAFDAVFVHYCSRVCYNENVFSRRVSAALKRYTGFKALFIQDEYNRTSFARKWIADHGIDRVFTVVPEPFVSAVYPPDLVGKAQFTSVLTGYVPLSFQRPRRVLPLKDRPYHIVYRGRDYPYWFGDLAREKMTIGVAVKKACIQAGLSEDIDWTEESRVYGSKWNHFIQSGRATLGTESGSNVFDLDGSIEEEIKKTLKRNPKLSYEEVKERCFKEENIGVKMNQISPKFFEFIATRTALILFEGEYSGILQPHRHFIPLKKDFSNLTAVFDALRDLKLLTEMTERTYAEIVESGKYTYESFVKLVDRVVDESLGPRPLLPPPPPIDPRLAVPWPVISHAHANPDCLKEDEPTGKPDPVAATIQLFEQDVETFRGMLGRRRKKIIKQFKQLKQLKERLSRP